ncbi:G-type lectin S-receptor-like serine/threonine-protein kinase [Camellia lanceoleosa]|uniref:G-type lectin S-receptor-like serine/threonine-protein kinase n=1 Tax=Camellia lanceoleosa TaxID=1840588 RepID=A0ACC0GUA7_9ERIC|nr:G-type lectin S-receptor-like serine/threonine-protein kinase [Camellia lanceoleosa]
MKLANFRPSMEGLKIPLSFSSLFSILIISNAVDTITKTQSITGNNTIVSSGGSFEMGFFRPGNSQNQYLGIWYKKISVKIRTVVWVANREIPLINSSGVLTIINPGILALVNGAGTVIWSVNVTEFTQNPIAQLMDTGNLVVKDANDKSEHFLWQSFDYPCDTQLPGMKLGKNFETGLERHITSWKSSDDPAQGDYKFQFDPQGYPQMILSYGSVEVFRSGPWNGIGFSGAPNVKPNPYYKYDLVFSKEEAYYHYELLSPVLSRYDVSYDGHERRWIWVHEKQEWEIYLVFPTDYCDTYNLCGPNGNCQIGNSPPCGCLNNFVPRNETEWRNGYYSNGCVRRTPLDCRNGDDFLKYSRYKMPDTRNSWFDRNMTLGECKMRCLKNCSCTAYTNLDISGDGSGCLIWFNELIDMREFSEDGQDIYLTMASSELVRQVGFNGKKREIVVVTSALLIGFLLLGISLIVYLRKMKRKNSQLNREGIRMHNLEQGYTDKSQKEDLQLPLFDLAVIANSTNNFSINNKIGEGGFGAVYKGILEGGQEIAVKRLSKNSSQGLDEFKNEVICINKLQHRNLVKLLGCCIQGEETMLIYEYMPNKSLDYFIFDQTGSTLLDWPKRFHIINGIARGLLYLHQDSRLRIIHRDLKASNILLDIDMNPKISDFGIARSFGGNETEANTNTVVGTYGYISPEYATDGLFSVKSDVFSFGVLVLEIVSSKKNKGFYHSGHRFNLLGHAWNLYKEGNSLQLIDDAIWESCYLTEVLRSIHIGLLCVQESPEDRPSMSSVVVMLSSDGALPQAKQPGFFTERNVLKTGFQETTTTANEITVTMFNGR